VRIAGLLGLFLGTISLAACFKPGPTQMGGAVTIGLSSSVGTIPLAPGGTTTITAAIYDPRNQGVQWTMSPVNFGSLSPQTSTNQTSGYQTIESVTYTAPANVSANTTVTITATSVSNPNVSASINVKAAAFSVSLDVVFLGGSQVPAAAQTIGPGQQLNLVGIVLPQQVAGTSLPVSWSLLPADSGSLSNQTANAVTYTAPNSISSPVTATITATSVSSTNVSSSVQITVLPSGAAANVAVLNVNGGAVPTQVLPNAAFTSVTVCNPGSTTTCQSVDGILVDTGSYGLRILQSQIAQLSLTKQVDINGNTLENCASRVDGSYLWGPVSLADVYIAGEVASSLPIQVISSSNVITPDGCSNGGTLSFTPQLLGANGILGIGPEPTDCTLGGTNLCDGSSQQIPPNVYYSCPNVGCSSTDSPVIVAATQQITNPVIMISTANTTIAIGHDNNGVILQLPVVSTAEPTALGTLTFGIGTESNNALGSATVYTLDSNDNFTTLFSGQTLTNSFIDSGSSALFFPDSLPICSDNPRFFCPVSMTNLSAQIQGATQGQNSVSFSIDNADSLFSMNPDDAVFTTLGGPEGTYQSCSQGNISCVFDWGLPFFYGQTVFSHIDACTSTSDQSSCSPLTGAWWAY
jgi:hypothetical protein